MTATNQLDELLGEDLAACRLRESEAFNESIGTKPLILIGASGLGRKALSALRADGIEPLAFIDNKWAGTV
jgi:hypothetical protein